MLDYWLALPGLLIWLTIFILPWRPWSTRESLDGDPNIDYDLSRITILVPARNEEESIQLTLSSLAYQGNLSKIILIDDDSTDKTVSLARDIGLQNIEIITVDDLPSGWSGKMWALEQGRLKVDTEYILLLDADIELKKGTIASLLQKADNENLQFVSLMASLRMAGLWEKLLMPSFIYFFKLLYPFRISNSESNIVAAAAGGCILVRTEILINIGGFAALKNELIDDCALARKVKNNGGKAWIGLTHSAVSRRKYTRLSSIWDMVTRTAFTQLRYSIILLLFCTILLFCAFVLPFNAFLTKDEFNYFLAIVTFIIMWGTYLPVIRYYNLNIFWTLGLPIAGWIYMLMIWSSAIRHWNGKSAIWKDRIYNR